MMISSLSFAAIAQQTATDSPGSMATDTVESEALRGTDTLSNPQAEEVRDHSTHSPAEKALGEDDSMIQEEVDVEVMQPEAIESEEVEVIEGVTPTTEKP